MTPNPDFKVRPFFDAKYSKNGYRYGINFDGDFVTLKFELEFTQGQWKLLSIVTMESK